eukprot:sb/3464015/
MADGDAGSKPTTGTIGTSVELISRTWRDIGEKETVNSFMNVTPMDIRVKGRVLPSLTIDGQNVKHSLSGHGTWRMQHFSHCIKDSRFSVYLVDLDMTFVIDKFFRKLVNFANDLGMGILDQVQDCVSIRTEELQSFIESSPTNFNYVMMPDPSYFGKIKMCEKDGKITQCITIKKVETIARYERVFGKHNDPKLMLHGILKKTNQKMGGTNWTVDQNTEGIPRAVFNEQTLILGAQLTHFPEFPGMPSIATVVGCSSKSLDSGRYINRVLPIFPDADGRIIEYIQGLGNIVKEMLVEYQRKENTLPNRIVYYYLDPEIDRQNKQRGRAGGFKVEFRIARVFVPRGDFYSELQEIRDACFDLYEGDASNQPLISIVMGCRQHKQYFEKVEGGTVDSGTVVDSGVTSPSHMEFYLYTGTPNWPPGRYTILHDDSQFTIDEWEMLSFYLCHCDSRVARVIGFPAPIKYAFLSFKAARSKLETCNIDWNNPPSVEELIAILEPAENRE